MGKPTICIGENKGADQLCGNCEADQRFCFHLSDSSFPLLLIFQSFKFLALFCDCTAWFVSDLLGNHIVGFPTMRLIYIFTTFAWVNEIKIYLLFNWSQKVKNKAISAFYL